MLAVVYRLYPLAIVAALAAGSIWLEHMTRSDEPVAVADNHAPDFMADTVQINGFAEDGTLHHTLDSPHVTHLPQNNMTLFELPRLQLFAANRRMWINADHGEASREGKTVDFIGNVEAERENGPTEAPLHFSSTKLTVWPDEQRAVSDVPVLLTRGLDRIDANHMEADNMFGNMKLSGNVRMSFPPKKRNP
jgi:lipopolysaccharide export system protein LptC